MPEMFRALVASPGMYMADGGPIRITKERTARWEREFNRLKGEGFSFPVPYGHKLNAVPTDDDPYALDELYTRWNATYVDSLERDKKGNLYMLAHVPPGYRVDKDRKAIVNDHTGTTIREVSPGIGDFIDGWGRENKDVLFHVALCTHPVQPGQPGFEPAGMTPARAGSVRLLSSAGKVRNLQLLAKGPPMAKDDDADDKGKKPPFGGGDADPAADAGGGGAADDPIAAMTIGDPAATGAPDPAGTVIDDATPAPLNDPAMPEVPAAPGGDVPVGVSPTQVEHIKQVMGQLGAPMLPDTSPANIIDRLVTLLTMAAQAGGSLMPQQAGAGAQPLDLSTAGATPDPNGAGAAGGMGAMGSPTFMSLKTGKVIQLDPAGRKLAENAASAERASIQAEWDRIVVGGNATMKALAAEEKQLVNRFHLSLNPDTGEVAIRAARARLADAKKWLAASGVYTMRRQLSRGTVQTNPTAGVPRAQPQNGGPPAAESAVNQEVTRLIEAHTGQRVVAIRVVEALPA